MFFPGGSLSLNFAPKVLKHFFRSVRRSPWRITLSLHPTEIPLSWILLHSDKHFASTVVFAQFVFATACLRPFRASHSAKSALLEFPSGSLSLNFAPKVLKHFFAPSAVRLGGLRYRFILRKFRKKKPLLKTATRLGEEVLSRKAIAFHPFDIKLIGRIKIRFNLF